jgi:hypothetical protein
LYGKVGVEDPAPYGKPLSGGKSPFDWSPVEDRPIPPWDGMVDGPGSHAPYGSEEARLHIDRRSVAPDIAPREPTRQFSDAPLDAPVFRSTPTGQFSKLERRSGSAADGPDAEALPFRSEG